MKYFEVNVKGTGRDDDPYRPDIPDGIPFVATDGMVQGGRGAVGGKMEKDANGNDIGPFERINGKMLVGLPEEWEVTDPNTQVKTKRQLVVEQINGTPLRVREQLSEQERNSVDAFHREMDPNRKAAAKATTPQDSVARKANDFGWDEATLKSWRVGSG